MNRQEKETVNIESLKAQLEKSKKREKRLIIGLGVLSGIGCVGICALVDYLNTSKSDTIPKLADSIKNKLETSQRDNCSLRISTVIENADTSMEGNNSNDTEMYVMPDLKVWQYYGDKYGWGTHRLKVGILKDFFKSIGYMDENKKVTDEGAHHIGEVDTKSLHGACFAIDDVAAERFNEEYWIPHKEERERILQESGAWDAFERWRQSGKAS